MPSVVFVADDLGVSAGVNRGIAKAAANGLVREASLCVTGGAVADGVQRARDAGIGIGLHLSLTLGRALAGPIAGLTDRGGRFRRLGAVLLATTLRRVDRAALDREVRAQLARLAELGVQPTHLNGHHHVHVMPVVRDVVFAAAKDAGVRWTRLPDELRLARAGVQPAVLLLRALARRAASIVRANGLRTLPFVGTSIEGRADYARRAEALARRLPAGPTEWMVHPRVVDDALAAVDPIGYRRPSASELAFLADPETAKRLCITPCTFAATDRMQPAPA